MVLLERDSLKIDYNQMRSAPIKPIFHNNIKEFAEHLVEINDSIENNTLLIEWDVDTDGLFSGLISENSIRRFFPNIKIENYINKDKSHGIKQRLIEHIETKGIKNLLVVDAGTNDIKEIKTLIDKGVHVTVIDHHEISERFEDENFILINCKDCDEGREVSGAYLVNDVFKQVATLVGKKPSSDYDELAVVSIISDVCKRDSFNRNILTNYIMGLVPPSSFLKIIKKGYHKNTVNSAVSISSSINALLRKLGTEEMMRIFSSDHALLHTLFFNTDKIKNDNDSTIYHILKGSKIYDFKNFTAIFANPIHGINVKDYASIVANKVAKQRQKLCMILLHKSNSLEEKYLDYEYGYSVRDYCTRDTLSVFRSLGIDANGHKQAFGGKLKSKIVETFHLIDNSLTDVPCNTDSYGQVINTENLFDGLLVYKDDLYDIAMWNTLSLDDERIGFKFQFNGNIIKKKRMLQLMHDNLTINCFDMTVKEGDYLICFPELDGSVNLIATKAQ